LALSIVSWFTVDAEKLEIELLFEGLFKKYGYDFRNYAIDSATRRVKHCMKMDGLANVSAVLHEALYDEAFADRLLKTLSVNVTEMFRDPLFYLEIRNAIVPILEQLEKEVGSLKIWHAGCSTGEEVYSMAILLREVALVNHLQTYATDFNNKVITKAKRAMLSIDGMKTNTTNYILSGGLKTLSDYYQAMHESVQLDKTLVKNVLFSHHNLATDSVFGEMQMIVCRNVLIYFDKQLQERVFKLFDDSLCEGGILCLGSKETLRYSSISDKYDVISSEQKIYRKKVTLKKKPVEHYDWILIGTSAGGFEALKVALSTLPEDFNIPILIVRHQSESSSIAVDELLGKYFQLKTEIAKSGEKPQPGCIYLAPPNQHLLIDRNGLMQLSDSEKVCYSRPSIDVLFESAAKVKNHHAVALVMTGANNDGAAGLAKIHEAGGLALVQNPESSKVDVMPKAALKAVPQAEQIWGDQIGPYFWDLMRLN